MCEWPTVALEEIAAPDKNAVAIGPFGSRMKKDLYVETGVPVIRGTNLIGSREFQGNFVYVSKSTADELCRANVFEGDLVFPHRGAIGEVGIVTKPDQRYMLSTSLMKFSCDRERAEPLFLYYFFRSAKGRFELLKNASQVGTPGIARPLESLRAVQLELPPLVEQQRIAHILGTLDDKIELNRGMNRTLETIARAIFKSWFIDFNPVIDNAILNGKPIPDEFAKRAEVRREILARSQPSPPSPLPEVEGSQPAPDAGPSEVSSSPSGRGGGEGVASYRHLFPDSFEDSPLGKIPKGWEVKPIVGIAEFVNGRNFTKNASGTGRMVIRIAELNRGVSGSTVFNDVASAPENTAHPDDILFAWSGSLGVFRWNGDEAMINQHIFKVISKGLPKWFVYFHLLQAMPYFRMVAAGKATTMGHIKRAHLADVLLSIPPAKLLSAVDEVVGPLYSRVHVVEQETRALERTRDVLLPYLLSGESASIRGDAIHD